MSSFVLHHGDCIEVMRGMPDSSVDSIVTDPPYHLTQASRGGHARTNNPEMPHGRHRIGDKGFMGKVWDGGDIAHRVEMWKECLRVLKPGGHLLAFSATRTSHRMVCAIEDAGFEIRDSIPWIYGSGFPKSLNVSKAIDKAAGAMREVISEGKAVKRMIPGADQDVTGSWIKDNGREFVPTITAPATDAAQQWDGWGTALKPAHEPICMARKPLIGTVAANVLVYGVGALNIDGCRVPTDDTPSGGGSLQQWRTMEGRIDLPDHACNVMPAAGRWPANIIHDGSDKVLEQFPDAGGQLADVSHTAPSQKTSGIYGAMKRQGEASQDSNNSGIVGFKMKPGARRLDAGSAARFFYCAKASRADRNEGVGASGTPAVSTDATMRERENADWPARNGNHHPTVKPTDLMAYLCRLVTPPGGVILDPFMGSGSTGKACMREGFQFIGIDMTAEYVDIARARITHEQSAVAAAAHIEPSPQIDLFQEVAA